MANYPTQWIGGKYRGSTKEIKNSYKAVISFPNEKQIAKYFNWEKYGSKTNAKKEADKWRYDETKKRNLLLNEYRYLDKDTIEVKLHQDKFLKTDAKFLKKVEENHLVVKKKKTKNGDLFYCHYRGEKKRTYPFNKLIVSFDNIKYKNGDPLDNRLCNIIDTGDVDQVDLKIDNLNDVNDQYDYFQIKDPNKLPKNKWILGKPSGTVFKRSNENIWTCKVSGDKDYNKTFSFTEKTKNQRYEEACRWQYETSYKLGLTKNLIRIINDSTIEVKLKNNYIMKTDLNELKTVQKYYICLTKSGTKKGSIATPEYYAASTVSNNMIMFHKLITGYNMTDHINRNTLDNCKSNLRNCIIKENNKNGSMKITNTTGYTGVHYNKINKGWISCLKEDDHTYSYYFSIKKFGFSTAKEYAILGRIKLCIDHSSKNGIGPMKKSWIDARDISKNIDNSKIKNKIKNLIRLRKEIKENTIFDFNNLPNIFWDIIKCDDEKKQNKVFEKYFTFKMLYYKDCETRMNNLRNILKVRKDKEDLYEFDL